MTGAGSVLIIFAKAPQPGNVKTRLSPLFDNTTCAAIHARLVQHTLESFCSNNEYSIELWCSPDDSHIFFQECAQRYKVVLKAQTEGSLGTRMHNALENALCHYAHAVVIGTDCPTLNNQTVQAAFHALTKGNEIVLGPAGDGGYVLLGANRIHQSLFADIQWGTGTVLHATLERLRELDWNYHLLPKHDDIDTPEDFHAAMSIPSIKPLLETFLAASKPVE